MKTLHTFFLCMLMGIYSFSQTNEIKLDESNNNKLKVVQTEKDSIQKSSINLKKSEGNTIEVVQNTIITSKEQKKKIGKTDLKNDVKTSKEKVEKADTKKEEIKNKKPDFKTFIENTDLLFKVLISICTFVGLVYGGYRVLKKSKK